MAPPIIIGSGLAGLSVALMLAPQPVVVLSRKAVGQESSSILAQGGIAAAVGPDDSPERHSQDTLAAGAGLCDPAIVRLVTQAAPAVIEQLIAWDVAFDRDENGQLDLGLEGAHSHRRIVHADGDSTGAACIRALTAKARATPSITLIDDAEATALTTDANGVTGVSFMRDGNAQHMTTDNVILATGGIGALWPHTTNPSGSWGQGLALAARSGAALRDLEFVQFHPTGIDVGLDPMPLASESLRGEDAILINEHGQRFMPSELAPRDVVSRAIWAQLQQGHRVFLDVRMIPNFAMRFPAIYAFCRAAGIDPVIEPIPIRPTAHYHMGGVAVDAIGRTSVNGLWACGEVAATGLHGANRLASNSLLEAVVFGQRIAKSLSENRLRLIQNNSSSLPPLSSRRETSEERQTIRAIMAEHAGVLRDKSGLEKAVAQLTPLAPHSDMALVGLMIVLAALRREESRGAHTRTDFPETSQARQRALMLKLNGKGEPVITEPFPESSVSRQKIAS